MVLIRRHVVSAALEVETAVSVLLPDAVARPPVLFLLHGRGDDDTAWASLTSIESYAAERGLAVVMPQGGESYYRDEVQGRRYWTYLSRELGPWCARTFGLSQPRETTFVAGLSMGGYGALHWALREPSRFAAAASLSGQLDVAAVDLSRDDYAQRWPAVFGRRDLHGTDADLLHLVSSVAVDGPAGVPALYVTCGTQDALVPTSRRFVAAAERSGVAVTADYRPGGHDWSFWDEAIQRVLDWLPLR